jgi:hypothetical protein
MMSTGSPILSLEYRKATRHALLVQTPIAVLALLLLDGGYTAKVCGLAMLGFWLVAALIAVRRPWNPTAFDLWYWRWGFIPCFVFALFLAAML